LFRLVVTSDDGDLTIGFEGFAWHTHGDIESAIRQVPEQIAVQQFLAELVTNRAVIAVSRTGGEIRDVWVTADVAKELKYRGENELLEFRFWDGSRAAAKE
jgi:hypothetical protein